MDVSTQREDQKSSQRGSSCLQAGGIFVFKGDVMRDGFCDYLYKVSIKQTPRQSSHSTAPIEGKDNTELDR